MGLIENLVEARKTELVLGQELNVLRSELSSGNKTSRKAFESKLKQLSNASRAVCKAKSAIANAANTAAHDELGIELIEEVEEVVE